jgi:tryptophan-rich sensory protein
MKRYRWWHAALFYAGVQAARVGLRVAAKAAARRRHPDTRARDREFYRAENLPVFAPPPVAFPIAWTVNSVCALAGALHVLNLPPTTNGRRDFLKFQAAAWTLFAAFDGAYFGMRSPINAAVVTLLYTAATAASLDAALRRMRDRQAALSLVTTAAWLLLANPVGLTQAAWNRDEFWDVGPVAEPAEAWLKQ